MVWFCEGRARALPGAMGGALKKFDVACFGAVEATVAPQLAAGAAGAAAACLTTAQRWSASSRGGGGLHWATYRACCRRNGQWRVDMNEELAEVRSNDDACWTHPRFAPAFLAAGWCELGSGGRLCVFRAHVKEPVSVTGRIKTGGSLRKDE